MSYKKIKQVGKGSFGTVHLVEPVQGGERLIMKEISLRGQSRKQRQQTIGEVEILKKVVHPNAVAYRDSFTAGDLLCICMEYAPGGDLAGLIKLKRLSGSRFTESEVLKIGYELTSALAYCHHELHLLHRDLKPGNIFVGADGSMKLGDFGLSKQLANTNALALTMCGTPLYMSPELCEGKPYDRGADVWALGCVLLEVCTLKPPWSEVNARIGINQLMQVATTATTTISTTSTISTTTLPHPLSPSPPPPPHPPPSHFPITTTSSHRLQSPPPLSPPPRSTSRGTRSTCASARRTTPSRCASTSRSCSRAAPRSAPRSRPSSRCRSSGTSTRSLCASPRRASSSAAAGCAPPRCASCTSCTRCSPSRRTSPSPARAR